MLSQNCARQTRKGFTLLELVLGLVLVTGLTAAAYITFEQLIVKTTNHTETLSLRAIGREAQTLLAFNGPTTWDTPEGYQALQDAVLDVVLATSTLQIEAGNLLALTPDQWPTNNEIGFVVTPEILVLAATANNGWCVVSVPTIGPIPGGCITETETVGLSILETINTALVEGIDPITDLSVPEPPEGHWAQIALGAGHGCGLIDTGDLWCWGYNNYRQLGNPLNNATTIPTRQTVKVNQPVPFKNVTAGAYHSCAQDFDNNTWCWGDNRNSQLGNGATSGNPTNPTPTKVVTDKTFISVAPGYHHTCGIDTNNDVWCWGGNERGQLGNPTHSGTQNMTPTPTKIVGDIKLVSLAASHDHTCGLDTAGAAWCWGWNIHGQLGHNINTQTSNPNPVPTKVVTNQTFTQISVGWLHTCAVSTDQDVWCWGFKP